ncbi:hypothetical protein CLV33_102324 [Jejuia pallidilutea]|uniref:Uncharacterized protein n=1 Tax=Jejuia pallidilutea TaxID=504487 RepID=A0A362X2K4_9FLAO|nr:DUF6544 family protein [Jejuia pallidilutea]PQV50462.1 hypothetical protein CLV33_102324 [Jejuia pallidilutea]
MRTVLAFLLIIHGIIHLIGFSSSYFSAGINKQILGIPKPIGAIWLVVFVMFMVSAAALITNKKWFYVAFIAAFVSQILIVLAWKDAKFGTIANIIIIVASYYAYSNYKFNTMVKTETAQILQNLNIENTNTVLEKEILHLPEIIQKWMLNSGVVGKENINSVRLQQKGKMKTKPNSKWLNFTAEQCFNVKEPAFIWSTKVDVMPMLKMVGRDKLINGKGNMLIKLAGIIPIVNEGENEKINSATMLRYLAEIVWFPSAALNNYIYWEAIDKLTVKATLTINEKSVTGVFKFSDVGEVQSFEAKRYYGAGEHATLQTWYIKIREFKDFNGYKIPSKSDVLWKLKEGDFNWLYLEITKLNYNTLELKNHFNI